MAHLLIGGACVLWVVIGMLTASAASDEGWSGAKAILVWIMVAALFSGPCVLSAVALLAMEGP